jgi:rubrerythrin
MLRTSSTSNADPGAAEDRAAPAPTTEDRTPPAPTAEDRTRQAGGPQDTAHYTCACGHAFTGVVTTGVACPACGAPQDW